MRSTVVIIGSHPRTREAFDFSRTDCDVWLFNEAISNKANAWAKRADAIFQMHIPVIWQNPNNRNDSGHYEWLKTQAEVETIWMQDKYPDVPRSEKFPLEDVRALLNNDPDHFLSSSVPMACGLAILKGYKRIEVYGVAMETNTEYHWQREGVAFWRGFAMGRGIDFYFADETYRCPLYGYDGEVSLPVEVFAERLAELEVPIAEKNGIYSVTARELEAAVEDFAAGENDETKIIPRVFALVEAGQILGLLDGARQENFKYSEKARVMAETSGDHAFSRQEFEGSAGGLQKAVDQIHTQFNALGGQLGLIHKTVISAAKGSPKRERMVEQYKEVLRQYLNANNQMSVLKGAMNENYKYMARLDQGVRAAGGEKSEAVILEAQNVG